MQHDPLLEWDGYERVDLFIAGADGEQIHAATLEIQVAPLIISPKTMSKVLAEALKELSKSAANCALGETVN